MELLAPINSFESLLTAHHAGADAFYAGAPHMNARKRAGSMKLNELSKIIQAAHSYGKKIYLAMNILAKDEEFSIVKKICSFSLLYGIDALIIQDLGVLSFINRYYPEIPVHASTQLFAYNLNSHLILAELGVKRVILPREMHCDEIEFICQNSPLEIETFVHGAMCFSFSGMCLFSDYLYNKSGNRGECSQICRYFFETDKKQKTPFAMKDLVSDELVLKFRDMGVKSFKIEGRLRSLAYLKESVSHYRGLLDGKTLQRKKMMTRKSGKGYFLHRDYHDLVDTESGQQVGIHAGSLIKKTNHSMIIREDYPLQEKDTIRVWNNDYSVTLEIGKIINNSDGFRELFVYPREKLSKISHNGDIFLINRFVNLPDKPSAVMNRLRYERMFQAKLILTFLDENVTVKAKFMNQYLRFSTGSFSFKIERTEENHLSEERIRKLFFFNRDLFKVNEISIEGNFKNISFIRLKGIKEIIIQLLDKNINNSIRDRIYYPIIKPHCRNNFHDREKPLKEIKDLAAVNKEMNYDFLISWFHIRDWEKAFVLKEHLIIRLPIFYSPCEESEWMSKVYQKKKKGFRFCLSHWSQVSWFDQEDVIGYYHLYSANIWSYDFFRSFGITRITGFPFKSSHENLETRTEDILFKELMIFRTKPPFSHVSRNGKVYEIEKFPEYSVLYEKPLDID